MKSGFLHTKFKQQSLQINFLHGRTSIGCVTIFLHAPQVIFTIADDDMYKMAWEDICELGIVPAIVLICRSSVVGRPPAVVFLGLPPCNFTVQT